MIFTFCAFVMHILNFECIITISIMFTIIVIIRQTKTNLCF